MKGAALKKWLPLLCAVLLLLTAAGCGGNTAPAAKDDSLQKVLDAGQLVLGLDVEYPPMGYIDESGEIVGFDIDMAQEVCNRLGITLVKQGIDWDEKENELNSGKIDCIWSGMSVTPGRAESMNLTDPYVKNELIFVVTGGSDVMGLRDLSGRTVGVQAGNTTVEAIEASELYDDITVKIYDSGVELMQKLSQGEVDAVLVDSLNAYSFIQSSDEQFYVLPDCISEEECAIGFRKADQALRDRVQEIISEMKADGTLGEISRKWFGSDITIVK